MPASLTPLAHLRGRHYVTDQNYERADLESVLQLAVALKELRGRKRLTPFLPGRHLGMIFEAASTRTRVSFENGFAELGGNALYLRPGEIHLPGRETIGEADGEPGGRRAARVVVSVRPSTGRRTRRRSRQPLGHRSRWFADRTRRPTGGPRGPS